MGVEVVSGLCAHNHLKDNDVHWNWLIVVLGGQWCMPLLESMFSDIRCVA